MTQRQSIILALCLILQSICGVLLQDPSEFGEWDNDAYANEYITQVPTVGENDVAVEAVDDRPADGSLADGSMMFSGQDDPQTNISIPTLRDSEGEEPAGSSETSSTGTLSPMLRSDDSPDSAMQEDASENLPTALPKHTIDPSWLRQDESLSKNNDTSDASAVPEEKSEDTDSTDMASAEANSTDITNTDTDGTVITSAEANSTDITNTDTDGAVITSAEANSTETTNTDSDGTVITSTEANSTDITNKDTDSTVITSTETNSTAISNTDTNSKEVTSTDANSTNTGTNSTEVIGPSSGTNSSDVTNPLTPGPANPPGVNDTMGGLNPVTEKPAENKPETTEESIPGPTAENIPNPTAEKVPEPTAENIPETTAVDIPNDTAPPSADATALAKAAAAGNADQGSDSGTQSTANGRAWGVILGIAITVGVVGLIIYVLQKRKHQNFSHSKLVEEAHPDPVLRLDNSEPLDLKYDGFGYYNPGLQGDNIQMSNFPSGHPH